MIFLEADVYLKSDKTLEEAGEILSRELFGGLPFGGRENDVRDEIPTIYIEPSILGLEILLMGGDDDGVSVLELYPTRHPLHYSKEELAKSTTVNMEDFIGFILRNTEGIEIMSEAEIEEYQAQFE